MFLAQRGLPPVGLVLATLLGGAMAAASAHALNCVADADIDVKMKRTSRRPLARARCRRGTRWCSGSCSACSARVVGVHHQPAGRGAPVAAIAFYVLVYTLLLKRRTSQNIVWGGAAGHAGRHRMGGGHRHRRLARARDVRRDLLLDAAALLGAGHALPRRLRRGRGADAARGGGARAGVAPDRRLRVGDGGRHASAAARHLLDLRGGRGGRRGLVPRAAHAARRGRRGPQVSSMALFHRSNAYLCGLFVAIAVDARGRPPGAGQGFSL